MDGPADTTTAAATRARPSAASLVGTAILGLATVIVISAGCVGLWLTVLGGLPRPLAVAALVALGVSPLLLALDLVRIDRIENRS